MNYLYIFEDGTMKQGNSPPNADDLNSIADGALTIVTFIQTAQGFYEIDSEGDGQRIPTI